MSKPILLFVCPSFPTFVDQDIKLLSERYQLKINSYNWKNKSLAPLFLIRQLFSLIFQVPSANAVLVHFGGYWSLFPSFLGRIFGTPVYIVLHGTDCASIPELNYGSLRIPLLRWFCGTSYKLASLLLPVSESLAYVSNSFYTKASQKNGFKYYFPKITTRYSVIPNGFDQDFWKPNPTIEKNGNTFISVMSQEQFILKGGDLILEYAQRNTHFLFFIAGMAAPATTNVPKNVQFLGRISQKELRSYFQKSDYFFQLSIFEGFGCALCEAMLCGCIPIGSNVNEIPEIIGDTGIIIRHKDIEELQSKVHLHKDQPSRKGDPRARIVSRYSLEKRRDSLFETIQNKKSQ